jgi:phage terminase large subunit-like protein
MWLLAAPRLPGDSFLPGIPVSSLPAAPQEDLPDVGAFREWKPEAQERALELLQRRQAQPWRPFYCRKAACDGLPHGEWEHNHSRADQRPPHWFADWLVWLLSGGRGSGKTRTGSEVSHRAAKMYRRLIFISPTGPDFRETMVEGESGLLITANPDFMPEWEPSKKKLTWPNGAIGLGYSAEEPDRLRGPNSGFIWADEPAHYPDTEKVWDNMLFGHRMEGAKGAQPKVVATSTPKPTKWMKKLLKDPLTITHRVSSYANMANLAESYKRNVLAKYEGTRLGKQEIGGELLEDVEGALWNWDMFLWEAEVQALLRIVVGIDPAGTANKRSDETGIVVVGLGFDKRVYVVDDGSGKFSPAGWADKSASKYEFWKADALVPEVTYGRDMVTHTLENSRLAKQIMPRIKTVDSRRGKQIRAEPVVALYEKKRVVHVGERGTLSKLEDELTSWVPGEGDSPNRVDALVHAITELMGGNAEVQIAAPPSTTGPIPSSLVSHSPGLAAPTRLAHPGYGIYLPR